MYDTLEMIYEGSIEIIRERINTLDQECETPNENQENL